MNGIDLIGLQHQPTRHMGTSTLKEMVTQLEELELFLNSIHAAQQITGSMLCIEVEAGAGKSSMRMPLQDLHSAIVDRLRKSIDNIKDNIRKHLNAPIYEQVHTTQD